MAEFDFSKVQKDVCEDVEKPEPIKEICPTCKPDPSYIEPDWTKKVEEPYFNKKTCEYMVTVTINKDGDSFRTQDFRSFPEGPKRNRLLRSFIQPALVLMLDYYGKVISDQILCAHFEPEMDFAFTTAAQNARDLIDPVYDSFRGAYDDLLAKPLQIAKDIATGAATGAARGRATGAAIGAALGPAGVSVGAALGRRVGRTVGASREAAEAIRETFDATQAVRPDALSRTAENIKDGLTQSAQEAIELIEGTPRTGFKPCKEYDPKGFTVSLPPQGEPYNIKRTIEEVRRNVPQITNPYALEIYARPKEFFIDPSQNLLKVLVAIPSFIFDSVPNLKSKQELEEQAATTKSDVELDVDKLFAQITRLSTALLVYGKYQSHFYQTQNGFLKIRDPEGGVPGPDGQIVESFYDYYASTYSRKIASFYDALREVSLANDFNLRSNIPSVLKKNARRLKIIFDSSDPANPYRLDKIRAKQHGCDYVDYTKQLSRLDEFFDDPTLMAYVAKLNEMDIELRARKSTPWLDFLVKYTFPVLTVSYGDLDPEGVEETAGSCVANNAAQFSLSLRDYVLDELLSLRDLLAYQYSSKRCSSLNDFTNEPEVTEFEATPLQDQRDRNQAGQEAKQETEDRIELIEGLEKERLFNANSTEAAFQEELSKYFIKEIRNPFNRITALSTTPETVVDDIGDILRAQSWFSFSDEDIEALKRLKTKVLEVSESPEPRQILTDRESNNLDFNLDSIYRDFERITNIPVSIDNFKQEAQAAAVRIEAYTEGQLQEITELESRFDVITEILRESTTQQDIQINQRLIDGYLREYFQLTNEETFEATIVQDIDRILDQLFDSDQIKRLEEIQSEAIDFTAQVERSNKKIADNKKKLDDLSSRRNQRQNRRLARQAARKARKEKRKEQENPYLLKARKLAAETIMAQDNLLTTMYDFSKYQEKGFKGITKRDFETTDLKDLLDRMTKCNFNSMVMASIRCLFSGVTEEDALTKIVRSALDAMDLDVFGFFIQALPADKQQELRAKFEEEFGNLPLPWEEGYDPGAIENTNPYLKKLLEAPKDLEEEISEKLAPFEIDQEYIDALQVTVEYLELELDILKLEKEREEFEKQKQEEIENLEKKAASVQTIKENPDPLKPDVEDLRTLSPEQAEIRRRIREGETQERILEAGVGLIATGRTGDIEDRIITKEQELERIKTQIAEAEETLRSNNVPGLTKLRDALSALNESEIAEAIEASSESSRIRRGGDEDNLGSSGTYGTALGNIQELVTNAYIDLIMETFNVEELLETLESFPGGDLITRVISDFTCSTEGMFKPPIKGFLKTLSFDPCGPNKGGIVLPSIKKLPNFDTSTNLILRMNKIFVNKIEGVITEVIKRMLLKVFEAIDTSLCQAINSTATARASLTSPDGFDDAMRDAFCPDGDDRDLRDTKNNLFKNAGLRGASPDAYDCLYRALNSTMSKGEYIDLLTQNPSQMNPEVTRRIAEVVKAFCPEFAYLLGTPDQVGDIFGKINRFVPPELRNFLRDQRDQVADEPVYSSVCLTQEEFDTWNRDRVNILCETGLDCPTAERMIEKANDRVLDDLGALSDILQKGPDGLLSDALDSLLSPPDPTCAVQNSALVFEDEEQIQESLGTMLEFFKLLEKNFYRDLVSRPRSLLNNILVDTNNRRLGTHELFVNLPVLFPNYVNSEEDWDFRKENGSKLYTWAMEKDRMKGMFPDTVGIWMHKQLRDQKFIFRTPTRDIEFTPCVKMKFEDNGQGEGEPDYKFEVDYFLRRRAENAKGLNIDETYITSRLSRRQKKKLELEDLGDGEITLFGSTDVNITDDRDLGELVDFDYSTLRDSNTYQSIILKSFLDSKVGSEIEINGNINQVFDGLNTTLLNFVKNSMLFTPDGGTPTGFNFGYDIDQAITFVDLLYVNPEADPQDKSTWQYTYRQEDKVLGKSATENPRVHFLDPAVHGGNYLFPKIYVEPATYNGWMGMMKVFLPETEDCPEKDKGFLDVTEISKRVKKVEQTYPFDERLSIPNECIDEYAYDKIAPPASIGILEGVILSHMRVYATEFVLRTLPLFGSIEFSEINIDNLFTDAFIDEMKKGLVNETSRFNVIQGYVYYLLFLEQAVQVMQRQVKEGLIKETPEIKSLFQEINNAQKSQDPKNMDANMAGAAIIAYGEEGIDYTADLTTKERAKILFKMGILTPFKMSLCSKINTLQNSIEPAKKLANILLQKEITSIIEKLSLNLRPRPHVQNINKYLLSKNGITMGSSLRSGEMVIENPVFEGESGIDYGDALNVVKDVNSENPLDGLTYEVGRKNLVVPEGYDNILEFLGSDFPVTQINPFDLEGSFENLSSFFVQKLKSSLSFTRSGIFYLEKYLRVISKDGTEQVYNIREFQDVLRERTDIDGTLKISDYFGDAVPISTVGYEGSTGIKFGVRLNYSPPSSFNYQTPEGREQERTYKMTVPKIKIRLNEDFYCSFVKTLPEIVQEPLLGMLNDIEMKVPSLSKSFPVVTFEQDIRDRPIQELDLNDKNFGEDLKCYIDKLVEQDDYKLLFDYLFPSRSYVSLFGMYSYYGFFESVGEDENERDEDAKGMANENWKSSVFRRSKETLRDLFNGAYRTDNEVKEERRNSRKQRDSRFLKNILPGAYLNIDPSVKWWQLFRIVDSRPFDADGKDCQNEFQKLFS